MRKSYKWTLGAMASLAIGCGVLGTTLFTKPVEAKAEEDVGEVVYYTNVGASEALTESEFYYENEKLDTDKFNTTTGTKGVNEGGLGVFATYRTNASVPLEVSEAGTYQVAALVDADGAITVNGGDSVSAQGKRVISVPVTVTDDSLTITVATAENVRLYAVMISSEGSKILMHSEWTEGQVVVYGKLLEDELTRSCPAYYSNGSVENAIEYSSIPVGIGDGSTGLNENFNAVTAKGVFKATETSVTRHLISMPEKLVYFVNAGSVVDNLGPYGVETDPTYAYNQTVFDYYRSVGSTLKNDGIPDQETTSNSDKVGHYEAGWNVIDSSLPYPFNTGRGTKNDSFHTSNLGFRLPDVEAGSYRVYIGTISYWHGRALGVKINGQSMPNIAVPPARKVHTFDVQHNGGTMDIYLTGAETNEACASFVALQKAEDVPGEAPAAITSEAKIVGLTDSSVLLSGVEEGARVQIYSGARPYNLIYEEIATAENVTEEGYKLNFGKTVEELTDASKIYAVQLNAGGYGGTFEFSVTDIQGFNVEYTVGGVTYERKEFEGNPVYTTGNLTLKVSAYAASGLDYYTFRKDYDVPERNELGGEYEMNAEHEVTENGTYEFVIYSLLGVSYTERIPVTYIDRNAPEISLSPVSEANAWAGDKFPVMVSVKSVSGVDKYEVVRNGEVTESKTASELEAGETLQDFVLNLTEAGEYLVTVTNSAKQSATATVVVGSKPVYSTLQKMPRGNDAQLTFGCVEGYNLSSLSVYQLSGTSATKLSVLGSNKIVARSAGTYVAVVKTNQGTTEVYGFEINADDFKIENGSATTTPTPSTGNKESYTGTIVVACIFGVALIALAVVFFTVGKKKPAKQTAQANAGGSAAQEEPAVTESKEESKTEEAKTEEEAAEPEEDDEV